MRRILIDNYGNNDEMRDRAVATIEEMGGGALIMDLKKNLYDTFGLRTKKSFGQFERRMGMRGIEVTWRRRRVPSTGNVLAFYPTRQLLKLLDENERIDTLIVLGWTQRETDWWKDLRHPEMIAGNSMPDWAKR